MVKSLTGELSSYMSMVQRVHHTVKEIFSGNGKLNRFIVRIYSRKFDKHENRNKRWEEVVTYQQ
jgi:hypothetical protein